MTALRHPANDVPFHVPHPTMAIPALSGSAANYAASYKYWNSILAVTKMSLFTVRQLHADPQMVKGRSPLSTITDRTNDFCAPCHQPVEATSAVVSSNRRDLPA